MLYNSNVEGRVYENENKKGGVSFFVHSYAYGSNKYYKNPALIELAINEAVKVRDVTFKNSNNYGDGYISYIHKKSENSNIYFVANAGNEQYKGTVTLKGSFKPIILNPHTGEIITTDYKQYRLNGSKVTSINVSIEAISSVIIYCGEELENTSVPLLYKGDPFKLKKTIDDCTFSFVFSLQDKGKIQLVAREDKDGNGYFIEIENGRLNLYKSTKDSKEILESFVVKMENELYYLFTFTLEDDLLVAYLSGNRIFEIKDSSFTQGNIRISSVEKAEIGDITVLGDVTKVKTNRVSYTFYLIVLMTLVILKFTKRNQKI